MEKQIEEMANDIAKICPDLVENCCGQVNCVTHLTLSLSKIGYRKASYVAREVIADMREMIKGYENIDVYLDRIEKKYESEGGK
jgi:hypothetical protein